MPGEFLHSLWHEPLLTLPRPNTDTYGDGHTDTPPIAYLYGYPNTIPYNDTISHAHPDGDGDASHNGYAHRHDARPRYAHTYPYDYGNTHTGEHFYPHAITHRHRNTDNHTYRNRNPDGNPQCNARTPHRDAHSYSNALELAFFLAFHAFPE